ncbi:sugar phosphate isomerase/epimerase [Devosia sp. SL43]|uniref:sugar phosphate isomerase/epimerase n=1 Tax=Devosia sp. SL43 TaxID=2806348 RepID=UPI001F3DBB8A|nr:sugar phosphate isomerase/epimerase [Devosia sp. SL43]UJW86975.1 sugar phosphate isomerase/epimerase [Devosia sp. SL43]
MAQRLAILQSLWAMQNLRDEPVQPALEAQIERIKTASFDGLGAMWEDDAAARLVANIARAEGLIVEGTCLPDSLDALRDHINRAHRFPIHHLNVQLRMLPPTADAAVQLLETIRPIIAASDIPVYLETHRGRISNDLLVMVELIERLPDLKLLADLSHYVVARELELPIDADTAARISTILDHAWAFHGRVAGSGQVQLPISFPQHAPWFDQFERWWTEGFASWRRRAAPDARLTFTCELGPQPYAISGSDGRDLTDRWAESLLLKQMAERAWAQSQG